MGKRTYLPMLLAILKRVCDYIIRYREQILDHLPPGNEAKLDAVITACNALRAVVPDDLPADLGDVP